MIFLYIAGAIILLLILLLLTKIKLNLEIQNGKETELSLSVGFIGIIRLPKEKKKPPQKTGGGKKKTSTKSLFDKLGLKVKTYDDVLEVLDLIKNILEKFKALMKHIVIKHFKFDITVGDADAAATAIKYGVICSAVYPIATILSNCFTFKPDYINVTAGFGREQTEIYLKTKLSVRIIYLIGFLFSTIKEYINYRKGV